jgi:Flp pilus assembly protein TadD
LGNCHFKASDYRSASQAYQKALALESKDKSVELTLGLCEIRQGRLEEARDRWKLALSWQPSAAIDDQLKEHLERLETWIELIRSHEP